MRKQAWGLPEGFGGLLPLRERSSHRLLPFQIFVLVFGWLEKNHLMLTAFTHYDCRCADAD